MQDFAMLWKKLLRQNLLLQSDILCLFFEFKRKGSLGDLFLDTFQSNIKDAYISYIKNYDFGERCLALMNQKSAFVEFMEVSPI
jgi:hypothetical protein